MGGFIENTFVRSDDPARVAVAAAEILADLRKPAENGGPLRWAQALATFAEPSSQPPELPAELVDLLQRHLGQGQSAGSHPVAYASPAGHGWVGLFPPTGGDPATLAKALSRRLQTVVVSFEIHDGDYLRYWLAQNGKWVDQFHSNPGYFGESVSSAQRKRLRGDATALALACANAAGSEQLAPLLADPPSDAFGLLDEIGEVLQIPNVLLRYDDLFDPTRAAEITDRDQFRPITWDDLRAARAQSPKPPVKKPDTAEQEAAFLQRLQAQLAKEEAAAAKRRARLERTRDPVFGVDYQSDYPKVVGNVVTFADHSTPEGRRQLIEAFLHLRSVLDPLVPRGFNLRWNYIYRLGGDFRSKIVRSSKSNDADMLKVLENENICSFTLEAEMYGPWVVACEVTPLRLGSPTAFSFSYDPRCTSPSGLVTPEWQAKTVHLLRELVVRLQAACGYLTLEQQNIGPYLEGTPFEYLVDAFGDDQFQRLNARFRGYFWGNILGPQHVEQLGGLDTVLATAPCRCSPFPNERGPMVYLQLTDDINHYSDDALRQLRTFLAPILPPGSGTPKRGAALRGRLIYD